MSGLEFDVDAKKLNAALKAVGPDRPVAKAIQIWPRGQGPASITSVNIFTSVKMSARTTKLGYKKTQNCQRGIPSAIKNTDSFLTTFISPQKVLLALSGPLLRESARSLVFRVVLETGVLLRLYHLSSTTCLCQSARHGSQLHTIQKITKKTVMFQTYCSAS